MIEIGQRAPEFRGEGSTVKGIVDGLKYNKVFLFAANEALDLGNANEMSRMGTLPFQRWRVIAFGMYWSEASTANEDPVVEFGDNSDFNSFGTMSSVITGGEKFNAQDRQKYDPLNLLATEKIIEASATLVVTWTEGVKFNIWQSNVVYLLAAEAAVAGMTSGQIRPYMVIEVDSGGKW